MEVKLIFLVIASFCFHSVLAVNELVYRTHQRGSNFVKKVEIGKSLAVNTNPPDGNINFDGCLLRNKRNSLLTFRYFSRRHDFLNIRLDATYNIKYPLDNNTCSFIILNVNYKLYDDWHVVTEYVKPNVLNNGRLVDEVYEVVDQLTIEQVVRIHQPNIMIYTKRNRPLTLLTDAIKKNTGHCLLVNSVEKKKFRSATSPEFIEFFKIEDHYLSEGGLIEYPLDSLTCSLRIRRVSNGFFGVWSVESLIVNPFGNLYSSSSLDFTIEEI